MDTDLSSWIVLSNLSTNGAGVCKTHLELHVFDTEIKAEPAPSGHRDVIQSQRQM